MLADGFQKSYVLGRVRRAALRIQSDRAEGAVFSNQWRNQDPAVAASNLVRQAYHVQLGRRVTHRTGIGDYPAGYSITDIHASQLKQLFMIAHDVRGDGFAGSFIDNEDDTGVERHNRAQLV